MFCVFSKRVFKIILLSNWKSMILNTNNILFALFIDSLAIDISQVVYQNFCVNHDLSIFEVI